MKPPAATKSLDHPDVAEIVAGEPVGVDDEDVVAARLEPVDLGGPGRVEVGDVAELVEDRAAGLAEQQRVDLGAGAGGGRGGGRGERAERREEDGEEGRAPRFDARLRRPSNEGTRT